MLEGEEFSAQETGIELSIRIDISKPMKIDDVNNVKTRNTVGSAFSENTAMNDFEEIGAENELG